MSAVLRSYTCEISGWIKRSDDVEVTRVLLEEPFYKYLNKVPDDNVGGDEDGLWVLVHEEHDLLREDY